MQKRRRLFSDDGGTLPVSSVIGIHEIDDGRFSQPRSRYNKRAARGFSQWIAIRIVIISGSLILLFIIFQIQVPINNVQQGENISSGNESSRTLDEPALRASLVQETQLQSLKPLDRDQYTIRIMTYRRNDQLLISLNHHSSCPGVALIQVVWCDRENFPPPEILHHNSSKVVVEFHSINSLNERFHILSKDDAWTGWSTHPKNPTYSTTDSSALKQQNNLQSFHFVETPTLGILSIDDDVLRPCDAIDAGFYRWTDHPDRMVGFDARIHSVETRTDESHREVWTYGYLSQVRKKNKYSLTLPRFCFLHRDYLRMYMTLLPRTIFNFVEENMNCEDISMSFFVSSMTQGKLPLLADFWAMQAMIKLTSPHKISDTSNHKAIRDSCVDSFADILGLKNTSFQPGTIMDSKTRNWFGVGVDRDDWTLGEDFPLRRRQLYDMLQSWEQNKIIRKKVLELEMETAQEAITKGLLDQ